MGASPVFGGWAYRRGGDSWPAHDEQTFDQLLMIDEATLPACPQWMQGVLHSESTSNAAGAVAGFPSSWRRFILNESAYAVSRVHVEFGTALVAFQLSSTTGDAPMKMPLPGLSLPRWSCALLALVMIAACATGPRVRTDMDPRADLSRYQSYGFYEPVAMEETGYTTYLTEQIRASIRRQMDTRGYRFDPVDPGLRVNFQGIVRERLDVYTMPYSQFGHFYSYRHHYIGYPFWYDQTQIRSYTEGTLTIDLVDAQRNHLVWTGSAIGRVVQRTPQERAVAADQAIASIFARFPYTAGAAPRPL